MSDKHLINLIQHNLLFCYKKIIQHFKEETKHVTIVIFQLNSSESSSCHGFRISINFGEVFCQSERKSYLIESPIRKSELFLKKLAICRLTLCTGDT